jgi:membrane-associated phospholipid phosphatase
MISRVTGCRCQPNGVVLAVTAVPVTAFLDDTVLKHLIDRTHFGQLSFPSGHTASAMTLATVLGVLLHDPARPAATRVARAALVVVACAVTALVAAGVIGLRWHYFTDTVGGAALGTGTVLTLAFLIDLVPGVMRWRRIRNSITRWPAVVAVHDDLRHEERL